MLEALSLDGKAIVVTGGGTGLGREMALALARAGADVVVAARRPGPIEETAARVADTGRRALAIPTDVTDSAQVERLFGDVLKEFGKVDVLVNNAGMVGGLGGKPIWEITDEEFRAGTDANLTGAFYCSRAVARHMVERGAGKIINVSSGFGLRGGRDNYVYACSKGAVGQLTRVLATSLGRYGVTSNCIVPGYFPTRGNGVFQGCPTASQVHTHWQGGRPQGGWPYCRLPGVEGVRLYERRVVRGRWRRHRRGLCADGVRPGRASGGVTRAYPR